jgi:hypothetical protein
MFGARYLQHNRMLDHGGSVLDYYLRDPTDDPEGERGKKLLQQRIEQLETAGQSEKANAFRQKAAL